MPATTRASARSACAKSLTPTWPSGTPAKSLPLLWSRQIQTFESIDQRAAGYTEDLRGSCLIAGALLKRLQHAQALDLVARSWAGVGRDCRLGAQTWVRCFRAPVRDDARGFSV